MYRLKQVAVFIGIVILVLVLFNLLILPGISRTGSVYDIYLLVSFGSSLVAGFIVAAKMVKRP